MTNPIVDPLVEVVDTSATSDLVRIEATVEGAVTVVLNRPARRNAFDPDLVSALEEAFRTLVGAEGVRVVFLRGAEGVFCAGSDLAWMREAVSHAEVENREDAMDLARMLKQLWDLPALTVALVEGPAYGAGAGLACACDMAVATAGATFSFAEVKLGLVPAAVAPYVLRAVGARTARGLFATGRAFDAQSAWHAGLVSEVVADSAALEAARDRIAREILACAPGAVAEAKRLAGDFYGRELDHDLMEDSARRTAAARAGDEGREGVAAFVEHRQPRWVTGD